MAEVEELKKLTKKDLVEFFTVSFNFNALEEECFLMLIFYRRWLTLSQNKERKLLFTFTHQSLVVN